MNEIISRLDKIIKLLETRNDIEEARNEMKQGCRYLSHKKVFNVPPMDASNNFAELCNCGNHKHNELTGGWYCPVHGQQF